MEIWILIALAIVISFWGISTYNSLITFKKRFENSFKQIDVQLERRYDLIPNLVETCKGYMKHESETLEKVIQARNLAATARQNAATKPSDKNALSSLLGAEVALGGALGQIYAISENYPDLKANSNMAQLMEELSSTENKISFARQAFNDAATKYNITREHFPNNIISWLGGFEEATLYELQEEVKRENVKVQF